MVKELVMEKDYLISQENLYFKLSEKKQNTTLRA